MNPQDEQQPLEIKEQHLSDANSKIAQSVQDLIDEESIIVENIDLLQSQKRSVNSKIISQPKVYKRRFFIVTLFACASLISCLLYPTCTPIAFQLTHIYGVSAFTINAASLVYLFMHPLFTLPASGFIEHFGLQSAVIVGSTLTLIGSWVRIFIDSSFYFVILGQCLAGIGRPFLINSSYKVCNNWFNPKERITINALLSFTSTVSVIFGIVIPGFYFGSYNLASDVKDHFAQGKKLTYELMVLEGVISFAFLAPNIIFMKDRPPTMPAQTSQVKRMTVKESIKHIISQKDIILIFLCNIVFTGQFKAVTLLISYILYPFGFKPREVSIMGAITAGSGLFSIMALGPILRKYYCYKKMMFALFVGGGVILGTAYFFYIEDNFFVALLQMIAWGLFIIPGIPLIMEFSIELAFPALESIIIGVLFAVGQLSGVGVGTVAGLVIDGKSKLHTLYGTVGLASMNIFGIIMLLFVKENLNRKKAEEKKLSIIQPILKSVSGIRKITKRNKLSERISQIY